MQRGRAGKGRRGLDFKGPLRQWVTYGSRSPVCERRGEPGTVLSVNEERNSTSDEARPLIVADSIVLGSFAYGRPAPITCCPLFQLGPLKSKLLWQPFPALLLCVTLPQSLFKLPLHTVSLIGHALIVNFDIL